jgi:hypothetical protein
MIAYAAVEHLRRHPEVLRIDGADCQHQHRKNDTTDHRTPTDSISDTNIGNGNHHDDGGGDDDDPDDHDEALRRGLAVTSTFADPAGDARAVVPLARWLFPR